MLAADACWGRRLADLISYQMVSASYATECVLFERKKMNAWMNNAVGLLSGHCHAGPKGTWALANQCSLLTRLVHSWA